MPLSHPGYRYLVVLLFVGIYVALGFMLKPDANIYLLMGIPLMLIFQFAVRREAFYKMWMREGTGFRVTKLAWLLSLLFAIWPGYLLIDMFIKGKFDYVVLAYDLAAIVGAFGAGYCFSQFTKKTFREFLLCLLVAGGIGILWMGVAGTVKAFITHEAMHPNLLKGIRSLMLYIPVSFMMEEVVFRGMLDSYLVRPGEKSGVLSALFLSVLWGLWHFPITPDTSSKKLVLAKAVMLAFVQSIVGVPLSLYWRRSGNLAVTAFTHAFIDAFRNAIL